MRRGTTPTITITADLDLSEADNLYLTFRQGEKNIIEKVKDDLEINENLVVCRLTQEETLKLRSGNTVRFQIRATVGGEKVASNIMTSPVDDILKGGEI